MASVEPKTTTGLRVERGNQLLVLADDALASDSGDDFEIAVAAVLAHPGNDSFFHVERNAFLQAPSKQRARFVGAAWKRLKGKNENANHGIGNQKRQIGSVPGDTAEHAAQRAADGIGLRDVDLDWRRNDCSKRHGLDGVGLERAARLAPASQRDAVGRDFGNQRGMRHGVEPAIQTPHGAELIELGLEVWRGASQGKSPY